MKTTVKSIVAKVMTAGLLMGALVLGTARKAEAQVSVGVHIGGPAYGPVYRPYRPYPYPVYRPYPAYGYGYGYPAYGYRPYYGPGYYGRGYYRGYRGPVRVHPGYGYYGRR